MRRKKEIALTLNELAECLEADVIEPTDLDKPRESGGEALLKGINTLVEAEPHDLSFVGAEKYLKQAKESRAAAFLVTRGLEVEGRLCLVVEHVWKAALKAFDIWYPDERPPAGVHPSAVVDETAEIDPTASVGPLAVVEGGTRVGAETQIGAQCFIGRDARIGDRTLLHPSVRILERVRVGNDVIIHSGAVLGADGFGYEVIDGRGVKIPQVGTVAIEDWVEIGANTCIDRAFLNETRIGTGSKIDNLVQIAHNVRIGRSCGLASQVGVAGSTTVGDGVIMWGQVGVPDHVRIGHGAELLARSGIKNDIADGLQVFGTPAIPVKQFARQHGALKRLPEALKRLKALERKNEGK